MRCNASHYTKALSISPSKWTSCTYRVLVPTLWYYNNDSKDLLWCKKTTTCESHVREYTSFYGLLQLHTNTSSLILWAPNYPKNILLQCIEAARNMSATTITYNTFLPVSLSVAISEHHQSIPGPSQVADQSTRYIPSLLIVPGKFYTECFGRCICLMLCRKRDGISI